MKRIHRKKELSEVQTLRLENRNLKSENTQLRKAVKRLERKDHYKNNEAPYTDNEKQLDFFKDAEKTICEECFKGEIIERSVAGRYWKECTVCDFRSKTIKVGMK